MLLLFLWLWLFHVVEPDLSPYLSTCTSYPTAYFKNMFQPSHYCGSLCTAAHGESSKCTLRAVVNRPLLGCSAYIFNRNLAGASGTYAAFPLHVHTLLFNVQSQAIKTTKTVTMQNLQFCSMELAVWKYSTKPIYKQYKDFCKCLVRISLLLMSSWCDTAPCWTGVWSRSLTEKKLYVIYSKKQVNRAGQYAKKI